MDTLFFWASKLAWAAIRPDTLLILLLLAALWAAHRNNPRRAKRLLALLVVCVLAIAILPLNTLVAGPLESRYPATPALEDVGVIVVLGGAEMPETTKRWQVPSLNEAAERYLAPLELARRFPGAKVYFTGGSGKLLGSEVSEASIARSVLVAGGLAPERLRLEAVSRNTAENAANLRRLVGDSHSGQTVLVTSAFHMPRAMAVFCAAGWDNLVAWPVDYQSGHFRDEIYWDFAGHLDELNRVVKEWVGLAAYRLTGRTDEWLGGDCEAEVDARAADKGSSERDQDES